MANRVGDATVDLLGLLNAHCPDLARQEVLRQRLDQLGTAFTGAVDGDVPPPDPQVILNRLLSGEVELPPHWRPLTLGQIPGVEEFVNAVSAPVQVIAAVLEFVAGVLDIISALLLAIPDPYRALIQAAYELLKSIIEDFLNTGAYLYFDAPGITSTRATLEEMGVSIPEPSTWRAGDADPDALTTSGGLERWGKEQLDNLDQQVPPHEQVADGFERWAFRFEQSLDDPGDDFRPVFSDGAPVQAVFIVATAPDLVNLKPILGLLQKLLNIDAFRKAFERFLEDAPDQDRAQIRRDSVAPDWHGFRLRDIGPEDYPLRKLEKIPEYLLALLMNVDDILQLIRDLIAAVRDKIELLKELIEIIEAVIEMIRALAATGLHVLPVTTDEGIKGLKQQFLAAENRPNSDPENSDLGARAMVGVCLVAGTTGVLPLWALLGEGKSMSDAFSGLQDDWNELKQQGEDAFADTKALAEDAWEGQDLGTGSASDLGLKGLGEQLGDKTQAAKEDAEALVDVIGDPVGAVDERVSSDLNALVSEMEQALGEGAPLDPRALAHIQATRRARRRGGRSLAMAYGRRGGGK